MITAIILTKNEEKNIKDCLDSLKWADEIIIIDDYSTDQTVEIARSFGAVIYQRKLNDNFASQRNFGLEMAKGDWILFIDADERISPELKEEIELVTRNPQPNNSVSYYINRQDYLFGKLLKHGETGNIKLLRLARKGSGLWERKVHEYWNVGAYCNTPLQHALIHYPHQTLTEFLKEINYYSDLNAKVFYEQGKKTNVWEIIFYPTGKFFVNYFVKLGFLDGTPGFLQAMLMSLHSFLTRGKLWQLQVKN